MLSPVDLPNDIATLKALLLPQNEVVEGLREQLNTRAVEIEHLKLQIAKLRRMQFDRKSEKLDHQIEQLELQLEDLQADEAEAAREMPAADQAQRKKSVRRPLPDHLPRDGKVYAPTSVACPACGGGLRSLGRGRGRATGVRAGQLPREPSRAPQTGLRLLRRHCSGTGTEQAD